MNSGKRIKSQLAIIAVAALSTACSDDSNVGPIDDDGNNWSVRLRTEINTQYPGGLDALVLPASDDFASIPQDPNNPLTEAKVRLGKMLFHDTGIAVNGHSEETHTWSCATCHHAGAGFKSGIPQGIGEGGSGFGTNGAERRLSSAFDANAAKDAPNKPDLQPVASPSVLNTAYQDVMLWNGQFGNSSNGVVNAGLSEEILSIPDTPKAENVRRLSGLEIQAIAGTDVHRLRTHSSTVLQTNETYVAMFNAAYRDGSIDIKEDAGKAIAAFERTVLANEAPFQKWLRGDSNALNHAELRGGILFFSKAGCSDCHRGPAFSSEVDATEDEMFMAIGFDDFDTANNDQMHGEVTQADREGRGGFTQEEAGRFKFKIPQLYNLADSNVLGHGASFNSIRAVLEYKNRAIPQKSDITDSIDTRFTPLDLTPAEMDDLEHFIKTGLRDPNLLRYQPSTVPSGQCVVVDPLTVQPQGFCPE